MFLGAETETTAVALCRAWYLLAKHPAAQPRVGQEVDSVLRSRERPEYAYYRFGGGPRMCIGDRFSKMEQTLVLAMTAQRFEVRVVLHDGVPDPVFHAAAEGRNVLIGLDLDPAHPPSES
jgi:cytochrome P450